MYLNTLDWDKVLSYLKTYTSSDLTKEKINALDRASSAEAALTEMSATMDASLYLEPNRPIIQSLDLIPLWLPRLKKAATLLARELKDVKLFFVELDYLRNLLPTCDTKWGTSLLNDYPDFSIEIKAIEATIDSEGNILPNASPLLESLYHEKAQLSKNIHDRLKEILHDHDLEPVLQDKFVTTREGRWVIPIKYGMQGKFPGIIHDVSNTGQSLFVEPQEIVQTNNKVREIEIAIKNEIERILKDFSKKLSARQTELEHAFHLLKEMDYRFALAVYAKSTDAKAVRFDNKDLYLVQMRNPILVLQQKEVISNTVELGQNKFVLLVSGPNAGGKTILLKSVGLAAQLARCGLPITCEENSRLPFFENIFISVGDSQNIKEGLSTFAAHMMELNESLKARPFKDLILIDEICGSTDPEEGAALARAFIEYYGKSQIFNITTSHLSPLKMNWSLTSGVLTASMDYDEVAGAPTYKLIPGMSGSSFAWKTAKKIGVADFILQRAKDFMSDVWKRRSEQMDDLENLKQELLVEKKKSLQEYENHHQAKMRYEKLLANWEKEKEQRLDEVVREAEKRLESVLDEIKTQSKKSPLEWKTDLPEIIKGKSQKDLSAEDFANLYPPGTQVFIQTLQRPGVVQSRPNAKDEVSVLSNSMRLNIHYKYLIPQTPVERPKQQRFSASSKVAADDLSLDVRGMSIEEALERLEAYIDQALQDESDRIKVIHGHGTNTLKKAIRSFCSRSEFVKKWQAGSAESGGDGITWIEV